MLLFAFIIQINAQVIKQQMCLGGSKNDQLINEYSFRLKDGSSIFYGVTNSSNSTFGTANDTFNDLITFKLDKNGELKWSKNIGLIGFESNVSAKLNYDSSGIYIVSDLYNSDSIINFDIDVTTPRKRFMRRIDLEGNILWTNNFYNDIKHKPASTYGGQWQPDYNNLDALVFDNTGNCLNKEWKTDTIIYTMISNTGITLWQRKYTSSLFDINVYSEAPNSIRFLEDRFIENISYGYHSFSSTTGATIKDTILYFPQFMDGGHSITLSNNTFLVIGNDSILCLDKNFNRKYAIGCMLGMTSGSEIRPFIVSPDNSLIVSTIFNIDSATNGTGLFKFNYITGAINWNKQVPDGFELLGIINNKIYGVRSIRNTSASFYTSNRLYILDLNANTINQRSLDSVFNSVNGYKNYIKSYSPVSFYMPIQRYNVTAYSIPKYNIVDNSILLLTEIYDTINNKTLYGISKFDTNLNTIIECYPPKNFIDLFREVDANNMFLTSRNNLVFTKTNSEQDGLCNLGNNDIAIFSFEGSSNTILGKTYIDNNNNNIYNIGTDILYSQGSVKSSKGNINQIDYLNTNGEYQNYVDTGTYKTIFTGYNNYYTVAPVSKTTTLATYGNVDTVDFALHPIGNIKDLRVSLVNTWVTRPGFANSYEAVYVNEGTTVVNNASLSVVLDNRLIYNSAVPTPTSIIGDTLKWNLSALNPSQQGKIKINFTAQTPPTLNGNDSLLSNAIIYPIISDSTPIDNNYTLTDIARNAFDPNDKNIEANASLTPAQIANGDYITYRVRFQNTGNFYATNVIILDTLENNLDWSSLQIIAASHTGLQTSVTNNNIVEFRFNNINLPAASTNEPASHGYVVFKIKPKNNLVSGNTIKNTAHITFDFNVPINTNIATARVTTVTATSNKHNTIGELNLYPNPNNGNFTVNFTSKGNYPITVSLFDVTGKIVYQQNVQHNNESLLQISDNILAAGLYNIQISSVTDTWNKKVMITK